MTLSQLNALAQEGRKEALGKCCGSSAWVEKMCTLFPVAEVNSLLEKAEEIWFECKPEDWLEAFSHHPKIGDLNSLKKKFAATAQWVEGEQSGVNHTTGEVMEALAKGNEVYEKKFGYIFIVCATGKTAEEMLALLKERLGNSLEEELRIAAAEQNKITQLRLQKLLAP